MSIIYLTGWEAADIASFREVNITNGTVSISRLAPKTGDYHLRCNPATSAVGQVMVRGLNLVGDWTEFTAGTIYVGFYFRYETAPGASSSEEILAVYNSSTGKAYLRLVTDGSGNKNIALYDQTGTALVTTGATNLSASTWYRLGFKIGQETAEGNDDAPYELQINGVSEFSGSGNLGTAAPGRVYFGKVVNRNGNSVDFYYDDAVISDSAFPGDCRIERMDPDGNSATDTGWTASGTNKYDDVDDIVPGTQDGNDGDTSYIYTSSNNDDYCATLDSCATAGISGTIVAAKTYAIVRDEGGTSVLGVKLRSSSATDETSADDPGAAYVSQQKIYETDPNTSAAWTTGGLDAVEVGVATGVTAAVRCTLLALMVAFTPAAGGSKVPVFMDHYRRMRI